MNRPDTSPANVARVLRELAQAIDNLSQGQPAICSPYATITALADALDQQAAVSGPPLRGALIEKVSYHSDPHDCPECQNNRWIYCHGHTPPPVLWEERVARAQEAVNDNDTKPDWLEIVLRAAFPELAPTDD